ncbi:serine hydrolase domain-containing protein [Lachnoclostridium phytofermentans]|uniref:Beta-lactamase n=1 Tax=Lachnoclostridium phytofermentans (strain ATCC 700394 / DSM 18823 / ISDg) TaxID=357809 RepID=A9KPT2_LACP7|nr:serine hydrolase domain-containing protein [Lachnoclostridium phytofermentans]ABX41831.1 beta-lactamase [Lachnoclostridium phytofermentans ISDg]
MNKELSYKINKLYDENPLFQDFNGYILVKDRNKIIFQQGFGYSDFNSKKNANEDTIFNIGSITKQFTAVCVLQLEQKGLLSIDDNTIKYLPDFINGKGLIIRDLLNMISGMPEYWCKPEWHETAITTSEDSYEFIKTLSDYQPPKKRFEYCNSNYIVLGKLIERVSGQSLVDYMNQNIFTPLNMKRTSMLPVNPTDTNLAIGYKSPRISKWEENLTTITTSFAGAGGIYSTAADLCKWDEALYTEKILCNELLKESFRPVLSGYAMGWFINGNYACHGGDAPGYSTKIVRISDRNLLVLFLCNFDGCKESNMNHYSGMLEKLILE